MSETALLIGVPQTLRRLERQLDLLPDRPITIGWVVPDGESAAPAPGDPRPGEPRPGDLDDLEAIIARRRPGIALVSLPAVMSDLVASIRTRLRRLAVPDRFMPTLEDQVAGVGPRTHLDIDPVRLLGRRPRGLDPDEVAAVIRQRRVLITGAGGSIGSELARIVATCGPERLSLMDRAENALFEIDRQVARCHPDLARDTVLHDVVDAEGTLEQCRRLRPQVIFHAAAHKHVPLMEVHPGAAIDNNLFGTKSIADAADAVRTERFVMISTDKAVNPVSIMGTTKRLAELYVQDINRRSSTAFSMVRFGNVLGSSGSVLDTWSRQIADGGPVTVTDPRMTRYFMTIPEAAALVIESAALVDPAALAGEVFVLDMGEPIEILALARRFVRLHGLTPMDVGREADPDGPATMAIAITGARPGEKLHEELAVTAERMCPTRHPDISILSLEPPEPGRIREILLAMSPELRDPDQALIANQVRRLAAELTRPDASVAATR